MYTREQYRLAESATTIANTKYNKRFDNGLFTKAIQGLSVRTSNALIDEALAICGHPFYCVSNRKWSLAAIRFLTLFDEGEQ
jgi:hypothetical protein